MSVECSSSLLTSLEDINYDLSTAVVGLFCVLDYQVDNGDLNAFEVNRLIRRYFDEINSVSERLKQFESDLRAGSK